VLKENGKTKNQHFQDMLRTAKGRGFASEYVLMESWYSALENPKLIDFLGWFFLKGLECVLKFFMLLASARKIR